MHRNLDDDFDTDNGYSGKKIQFCLSVRDRTVLMTLLAHRLRRALGPDNDSGGNTGTPLTSTVLQCTVIGPYRGSVLLAGTRFQSRGTGCAEYGIKYIQQYIYGLCH